MYNITIGITGVVSNDKGDLLPTSYFSTKTSFKSSEAIVTFRSDGSVDGTSFSNGRWVENDPGWSGAGFYTMSNISIDSVMDEAEGNGRSSTPSSGSMTSNKVFSASILGASGFSTYGVNWSCTISDSKGNTRNYSIECEANTT